MSDEENRIGAQKFREQREADLVSNRIREVHANPVHGNFDANHLKAIHAYIFQDFPHHKPGVIRSDTEDWIKHRVLEGQAHGYDVHYASRNIESRISGILKEFGGPQAIEGKKLEEVSQRLAELYGKLDHAHGFYEGNSRTLREFTRKLALDAGFKLDWVQSGIGIKERNELYIARDLAVLQFAFPSLTPEKAMETNDRAEYEASFTIAALKRQSAKSLQVIIFAGLTPEKFMKRDDREE